MDTTDDDAVPAWATGPDCFENDAQRADVESDRFHAADGTIDAYCGGDLHALANAIEDFQSKHRLLLKPELDALHDKLVRLTHWLDARCVCTQFPLQLQRHPTRYGHSA